MNANVRNIDHFRMVMEAVLAVKAEILTMEIDTNHFIETFNILEEHDMKVIRIIYSIGYLYFTKFDLVRALRHASGISSEETLRQII